MFLKFVHMRPLLFISISISLLTISSRPIITDPELNIISIPSAKNVTLTSSDGYKFKVRLQVALQSDTMMQMIIDGGLSDEITLSFPNITGETISMVLEYCNKHLYHESARNSITTVDEMRSFDAQFVDVHYETLFNLFRVCFTVFLSFSRKSLKLDQQRFKGSKI
ncbi:putative S-phase kinase-associated protein [Helianthus debilis subsp. tardiflorus]